MIKGAAERGLAVVFNPSPMPAKGERYPYGLVNYLVLNETEAGMMTGESEPRRALDALCRLLPTTSVVLTVGENGCYFARDTESRHFSAYEVEVVDPTAAGDTFLGYFATALSRGMPIERAIPEASAAAALAVTKVGAVPSIPGWKEVEAFAKTARSRGK
jgi:ribokinase